MNRISVAVLMSLAPACLAVAFVVIAVISEAGATCAWIASAATAAVVGSAPLRVGTFKAES